MTPLLAKPSTAKREALPAKDNLIIVLIIFFSTTAITLEGYWLIFNQVMEGRTDLFASIIALYTPVDYTYRISGYPAAKSFTLAIEGVNTLVTPWLSFLLIWAIVRARPYRYPLQLAIAAYTFYGTLLYYLVAHISGYAVFADHGADKYVVFYLASLPWLAGYAWMGWDAYRAITRRYRGV